MGSVVHLNFSSRHANPTDHQTRLLALVAQDRRIETDVFWLKENAELLNVLASTGSRLGLDALRPLSGFYETLERRIGFFPQYYRFLLSMCLDLEDLGLPGTTAEWAVSWVQSQGLVTAELSDLQRAEARRLCLRRGIDPMQNDPGLDDRLREFGSRSTTFAIPNKKAAYELTHIVFYLSQYGARDPNLPDAFLRSLRFAGTVAFLELNIDLLSEICLALRFANHAPPSIWEDWLLSQASGFLIVPDDSGWQADDYHTYLMMQWFLVRANQNGFSDQIDHGSNSFKAPRVAVSPLREMSECLFGVDGATRGNWPLMQARLNTQLSSAARDVLDAAQAIEHFDAFFEGFARAHSHSAAS